MDLIVVGVGSDEDTGPTLQEEYSGRLKDGGV
jgi:hypothetical protein